MHLAAYGSSRPGRIASPVKQTTNQVISAEINRSLFWRLYTLLPTAFPFFKSLLDVLSDNRCKSFGNVSTVSLKALNYAVKRSLF